MTVRVPPFPPVLEDTAAAGRVAFPKGNLYVDRRAEFGTLYEDQLLADLSPSEGRPVEVAPWRLALVLVRQDIEGLTDRQVADAVRRCMDWKYALSLELTDPGFDCTLRHDFRCRVLAHAAGQRFLDTVIAACNARGWVKTRGTQCPDSTHVLAATRTRHRLACVREAMPWALNQLSDVVPAWVPHQVPPAWYTRNGLRADHARLPKDASTRETLARQVGADGYQLLAWGQRAETSLWLHALPALEALRRMCVQPSDRCTVPGRETLRWRTADEQPPSAVRIASPDDLEARSSSIRETQRGGLYGAPHRDRGSGPA
jgi:transposase